MRSRKKKPEIEAREKNCEKKKKRKKKERMKGKNETKMKLKCVTDNRPNKNFSARFLVSSSMFLYQVPLSFHFITFFSSVINGQSRIRSS